MTLYHGDPHLLASHYRADPTPLTTMVYGTTIPEQHLSYMVRLVRGHPTRVGLQLAPAFTTADLADVHYGDLRVFTALAHAHTYLASLRSALDATWPHARPPPWRTKITRVTLNADTTLPRARPSHDDLSRLLAYLPSGHDTAILTDEHPTAPHASRRS